MSTEDDGLSEYERLENLEKRHGQTYWTGRAEGGPLDGSGITIEAVPFLAMRGLHVNVCVGDDVETSEWHLYAFGQRMENEGGIVGFFRHLGTIDGDPKPPKPQAPDH